MEIKKFEVNDILEIDGRLFTIQKQKMNNGVGDYFRYFLKNIPKNKMAEILREVLKTGETRT